MNVLEIWPYNLSVCVCVCVCGEGGGPYNVQWVEYLWTRIPHISLSSTATGHKTD